MEAPRGETGEGQVDYAHDARYVRDLRAWNEAQLAVMFSERYQEDVAARLGKPRQELTEDDIVDDWARQGSEQFRREHGNDPAFYRLRGAA